MKNIAVFNKVGKTFNKATFKLQKHSPEILVVAGVVGVVASAVLACKATTKANDILVETKEDIEKIHKVSEMAENNELTEQYTEEDAKKDLAIVYVKTGLKFVKLYAPAVALGVLSITSILASNNILRKRNVAIAAAYATVDKSFKEYRGRVVERFGEAVDKELKYNIKAQKVEKTVVDEETGKKKKVKESVEVADPNLYSDYARFFDCGNDNWEKDAEYNLMFLRAQQQYANDLLRSRGRLFLNEVYRMLGIPETKASQVVGWVYDPDNPEHEGDNYVDFGIYDINKPKARDFVNGYERTILLDFNVDGNVWELM